MIMTPEQRAAILTNASIATDEATDEPQRSAALAELRAALDDVQEGESETRWRIEWIYQNYISFSLDFERRPEIWSRLKTETWKPGLIEARLVRFVASPWTTVETLKRRNP